MNFKDKVVIITGAGAGIGQASAVAFARRGAKVVVTDLTPNRGEETISMIKEEGKEGRFVQVDVSDGGSVNNMVEEVRKAYETIDILVNNAGIHYLGDVVETPEEAWARVMNVNLKGVYLCLSLCASPNAGKGTRCGG